ncbi:MAG: hypothetical protein EOP05_10060 [Proteobacteria bacterium]|nr:MAG: hypothetical protein EOP05_10060 [Pseudomonadota bacterium]
MNGKFTVGHGTGGGAALLDRRADWIEDKHEVDHFTEVLQLIRPDLHSAAPYFSASAQGLPGLPDTYTCVHPGAGAQSKKLSPETWSQVLRGSADPLVICGTPQDSEWARSLDLDVDRPVIDLTSGLSIADFYRVVSNAKVTHVLDSFSAHLAAASDCPRVLAHFLPSSDPVQWRPLGPNVEVVLHANP